MMERWQGMMMGYDPELPPAYKRVNWLQSAGTGQYIETSLTSTYKYRIRIKTTESSTPTGSYGYFGWFATGSQNEMQTWASGGTATLKAVHGTDNATYDVGYPLDGVFEADGAKVTCNGYTHTGNAVPPDVGIEFCLFGYKRANGTVNSLGSCRIYSATFWTSGGTMTANYIPCIRGSDSKPGMYDTVSKTFLTNSGTGELTYG